MGAFLSKFTTHSNACEPTKYEEYSDGEEITILQTFRKNDLAAASRYHQTVNYRPDKMDSVNNKACAATRPPPGLIPKSKWSRVPDLQKYKPPPPSMISARPPPRLNGYPCDNETNSTRNTLVNGNSLSFKSHNSQHLDSTSNTRRNFSNYMNSAVNLTHFFGYSLVLCLMWPSSSFSLAYRVVLVLNTQPQRHWIQYRKMPRTSCDMQDCWTAFVRIVDTILQVMSHCNIYLGNEVFVHWKCGIVGLESGWLTIVKKKKPSVSMTSPEWGWCRVTM